MRWTTFLPCFWASDLAVSWTWTRENDQNEMLPAMLNEMKLGALSQPTCYCTIIMIMICLLWTAHQTLFCTINQGHQGFRVRRQDWKQQILLKQFVWHQKSPISTNRFWTSKQAPEKGKKVAQNTIQIIKKKMSVKTKPETIKVQAIRFLELN